MLEHPSIQQYSFAALLAVDSKNLFGADNQQETERDPQRLYARHSILNSKNLMMI